MTTTTTRTVHVVFLLDRSGSMESIHKDVVRGFNAFIEEQKAQPGDCRFTLMQFDSRGMDYTYLAADLQTVVPMGQHDFQPRAGTPLYDAIGKLIGDIDARAAGMVDKEIVLFIIFTDGEENGSMVETRQTAFLLIETHQGLGWIFTFLGANQNAYAAGANLGIAKGATSNFAGDARGTSMAYSSLSVNTSALRGQVYAGGAATPDFFAPAGKAAEDDLASRPTQAGPPKASEPAAP